jgi:hypothetical protein
MAQADKLNPASDAFSWRCSWGMGGNLPVGPAL